MSLTCHEEIGRVGRVGRRRYDDAIATCSQQVVRVGLVEFGERHDTRTNGQRNTPQQTAGRPIRKVRGKLNGEVARHARHAQHHRSILARMSRVSEVCRGCYDYEDVTRKLRGNCCRRI